MSTIRVLDDDYSDWQCHGCSTTLVPTPTHLEYLESRFTVELPACPCCGFVLIPEHLALGKMLEVEHLLEDK